MNLELALKENTEAIHLLISAMQGGNTLTPVASPQPKTDSNRAKKAEQENPRLEDQPLPVAVALAALYGNEGRYLDSDKLSAAVDVTETLNGKDRNEQIDALTMALKGVPRAPQLHGEDVFDLAIQIIEHWDTLPGITERREYAELLLDTPRDERAGVKPTVAKKETEPTVGDTPEEIFERARNLIMELTTGGYRNQAIDILNKFGAQKLGQVPQERLAEVVTLAKQALAEG
ncbi:MAG: hypothetical protein EKE12_01125 [Candidatus Symbiopectobacterium sp. Clec_Harlan]|uniref:hypothetical protein n=1 Tax=Symbiopectobacterium sp. TaxID=2952789 RepID=UPI001A35C6F2|nr:hypothetical protein [Candidatus Symbiopectobacterium sp. Clec_Harlan]